MKSKMGHKSPVRLVENALRCLDDPLEGFIEEVAFDRANSLVAVNLLDGEEVAARYVLHPRAVWAAMTFADLLRVVADHRAEPLARIGAARNA